MKDLGDDLGTFSPSGPDTGPGRVYCDQLFADHVRYASKDRAKRPQASHGAKAVPLFETFNGTALSTLKLRLERLDAATHIVCAQEITMTDGAMADLDAWGGGQGVDLGRPFTGGRNG